MCSGGQHAMEVALTALTRPGDTVLAESLTYPGLKVLANRLHLRLHGVAMDEQGLQPDALEAACRGGAKVLFCLPNLQNPTGAVMPEERRRRIATVVRKHALTVVEDDAYGLLLDRRPPPLCTLVPEPGWFIGGVSKLLAPGLRIGYLAAPADTGTERLAEEAGLAVRMTPPLMAEVAARWVHDGTADELVVRRRREAQERLELAREVLAGALPKPPPRPHLPPVAAPPCPLARGVLHRAGPAARRLRHARRAVHRGPCHRASGGARVPGSTAHPRLAGEGPAKTARDARRWA